MSSQILGINTFCFEGIQDIKSILDALKESDPEAHREMTDALRGVDWAIVRKQVGKLSLQELAKERSIEFADGELARKVVVDQKLYPVDATTDIVGIVRDPFRQRIELGLAIKGDGTCECFGNRMGERDYVAGREVEKKSFQEKPRLQARLEELYREQMTKAVFKIVLGTDAEPPTITKDGTVIMRFPILKEEV